MIEAVQRGTVDVILRAIEYAGRAAREADVPSVIEELNGEVAVDAVHVRERVDEWIARLLRLYDDIVSWVPQLTTDRSGSVEMNEEVMREHDVDPVRLPVLRILDADGEVAQLVPRGLWIIGANGRVDLFSRESSSDRRSIAVFLPRAMGDRARLGAPGTQRAVARDVPAGYPVKDLAAIEAVFSELSTAFDIRLKQARLAGDASAVLRLEERQRINDSAYFILAWGQLEAELNAASEAAVRNRRSSVRWEDRRAWDAHDPDNMRAKFEDRAALVLDRFNTSSDAYRRTIRYYGWRNNIAHGTSLATGIDVALTIRDLYQIASEIRR